MTNMQKFKNVVASLGEIWTGDHVYFSQTRDDYSAQYAPSYPRNTFQDILITWDNIRHEINIYTRKDTPNSVLLLGWDPVCKINNGDFVFCKSSSSIDWLETMNMNLLIGLSIDLSKELTTDKIIGWMTCGVIECIDMEPTDTEGWTCDAIYQFNGEEYSVYLSRYDERSYEEQAAEQIFDAITKEGELER